MRLSPWLEGGALFVALLWFAAAAPATESAGVWAMALRAAVVAAACVAGFYYTDLYDPRLMRRGGALGPRLWLSLGVAFALASGFHALSPGRAAGGGPLMVGLLVVTLVVGLRAVCYGLSRWRRPGERVLVLGSGPFARRIVEELLARTGRRSTFGIVGERPGGGAFPPGCPTLGPLGHLDRILATFQPHRIVVALEERRGRLAARPLLDSRVRGVVVEDGVDVFERLTGKLAIESLAPSSLLFGAGFRRSRVHEAGARLLSVAVAGAGLVVLGPLLALVALAIVVDSGRPVLFVQDRVGIHGRRFRLLKFRTMRPDAGATSEWAQDNGDRITRLGRWLRRFRVDELPQFLNVLAADMNLIGPRPHPLSNFRLFSERIPYYSLRSAIRPGVSGWAQVRYGYANNLAEETEKMRYDLYYLKHRSLWLDLRILLDTLKVVALGRGAAAAAAMAWTEPPAAWTQTPAATEAKDAA